MPQRVSLLLPQTAFNVSILNGYIDGAPELRHEQSVEVTQFPIGKDAYVTDHAIVRPFTLGGRLVVSNRVSRNGTASTLQRMENAWDALRSVFHQRLPVQVGTAHATYAEMLFTRLSRDESAETGTALVVDFQMQQIQRVGDLGTSPTGDEEPTGGGGVNEGTLDRGFQPLVNTVFGDRSGTPTSGNVPVANVVNQRLETELGTRRVQIEISWHTDNEFWELAVFDTTGSAFLARKLFAGPVIRFGDDEDEFEVISNTGSADPPAPTETGPWGSDFQLQWKKGDTGTGIGIVTAGI